MEYELVMDGGKRRGRPRNWVPLTRITHSLSYSTLETEDSNLIPAILTRVLCEQSGCGPDEVRSYTYWPIARTNPLDKTFVLPHKPKKLKARPVWPVREFVPPALREFVLEEAARLRHRVEVGGVENASSPHLNPARLSGSLGDQRVFLEKIARHPRGLIDVTSDAEMLELLRHLCAAFRLGDVMVAAGYGPRSAQAIACYLGEYGLDFKLLPFCWCWKKGYRPPEPGDPPRRCVTQSPGAEEWGIGHGRSLLVAIELEAACSLWPKRLFAPGDFHVYGFTQAFDNQDEDTKFLLTRCFGEVIYRTPR
jgi:hypothetical protein